MLKIVPLAAIALLAADASARAAPLPQAFKNPAFFPISVWWQAANGTGHSGPYPTIAAATAAAGINIMLGQGANWPETFGADFGEFEAIKQNGLYLIGGINVPWNEDRSNLSVASILSLAQSIGAQNNLLGYNAGDEPLCGGGDGSPTPAQVPEVVGGIESYDPTRPVWFNETAWETENPTWIQPYPSCYQQLIAALQATTGAASFDLYPLTRPWSGPGLGTDYNAVPNDTLWMQGVAVQALAHYAAPGQRLWAYIESGGDNFGFSAQNGSFTGRESAGSDVLTGNGPQQFGPTWVGMTVSGTGLPTGTTIQSVINGTEVQLSQAATSSGSVPVAVSGGANNSDCVASVNLCLVNGNEYRPTGEQVNAEVWMSIINGATGIEYFCHDSLTYSFCLDDIGSGGSAAKAAFQNLQYVDGWLAHFARMLNDQTLAQCSMDQLNYATAAVTTAQSCTAGNFTFSTSNPAVPGAVLVKSHYGAIYVIAQSSRRSTGGATFTFSLPAIANNQATVIYDSNNHFDQKHTSYHNVIAINSSGVFTDTIGGYDDYQVKIYSVPVGSLASSHGAAQSADVGAVAATSHDPRG